MVENIERAFRTIEALRTTLIQRGATLDPQNTELQQLQLEELIKKYGGSEQEEMTKARIVMYRVAYAQIGNHSDDDGDDYETYAKAYNQLYEAIGYTNGILFCTEEELANYSTDEFWPVNGFGEVTTWNEIPSELEVSQEVQDEIAKHLPKN